MNDYGKFEPADFCRAATPEKHNYSGNELETTASINTTPDKEEAPTWADLGNLTKNMQQALNEVLYHADLLER